MTSILDPDRHRFDRSAYERPNYKFRCGRAATWGKPCMGGPNLDGSCGGTTACSPVKNKNDRFECRRSAIAGGPCEHGPDSDGSCSVTQPPCSPRRSLRGIRGRLSVLALGLVLAFIGGSMGPSDSNIVGFNWTIPGPLTDTHANFITAFPKLDDTANDTFGGALGIEYLFALDKQIVVEIASVQVIGGANAAGRAAVDDQYAVGFRFQLPISAAWILRWDGMYGIRDSDSDIAGFRFEVRRKF